ncbi:methylmalonyl-CoA epimerase [Auraticoccus monumenti]|uniref:Methylmalonyl-CoA epimerase n=1 Tax=Auraticoccus monumenti TaxID=675864 RepID=A0A1G7AZ84_9ACTN|nr:methylmalonyl-CoA epimerase [Auraticoccus monumenti]SDE20204.1 methylmalonyl-CoA epimerase [Auraticoccus monumenti]
MSSTDDPDGGRALPGDLFEGVDHIGYAVPDLEEALALHTGRLGWRLEHREHNEEQGVEEAMLTTGDGLGARVQLLAPTRSDSPIARHLERRGPGVQQVAYRVRDLEQVSAELRRRGFRLLQPEARRGTAGSLISFLHPSDTGGVLVELVQPAATGGTHRDVTVLD